MSAAGAVAGPLALKIHTDGAARGNPGPAGAGAVLLDADGNVVARAGRYLGRATNNVAEYEGVLLGLEQAAGLGASEVEILTDSELLVRQISGQYRVKAPHLRPLVERVRTSLARFERHRVRHVPRAENAEADEMANRAIDERLDD